jgi:hypothetical protein
MQLEAGNRASKSIGGGAFEDERRKGVRNSVGARREIGRGEMIEGKLTVDRDVGADRVCCGLVSENRFEREKTGNALSERIEVINNCISALHLWGQLSEKFKRGRSSGWT